MRGEEKPFSYELLKRAVLFVHIYYNQSYYVSVFFIVALFWRTDKVRSFVISELSTTRQDEYSTANSSGHMKMRNTYGQIYEAVDPEANK